MGFLCFSTLVKELQEELYSIGFDSEELCPLIEKYIGHFKRRYMTSIEKYIILGLAFFHLSKEIFQMAQVQVSFKGSLPHEVSILPTSHEQLFCTNRKMLVKHGLYFIH
jgi:hypothetical protein